MSKINSYDELVAAVKNKDIIPSNTYKKFGTTLYDMYVNIYGAHYCKECGQELTKMHFTNLKNGFKDCCCATCTNLNKYGVENPSQLESVKQKKYGYLY